ncbi:MAG: trypsin-like peptidase domain-containing protein [Chloroflexi bacterium]|nr:trypsin-like peptidase domain-containing protein [Chloroflexota bacterium]
MSSKRTEGADRLVRRAAPVVLVLLLLLILAIGVLGTERPSSQPAIAVYDANGARVVNIISSAEVATPLGPTTLPQGFGSGFVYDTSGHIVTNDHVIQDVQQLRVTFKDQTSTTATLVGRDPETDLAVLSADVPQDASPVTLGDSDNLRIGQMAFAIGSPRGLEQTMTQGIVSAVRDPGEDVAGTQLLLGGVVQTDAAINPGNSGGPLFDAAGNVIGVNTAIFTQSGGSEGLGLAIPVNVVKRIVPDLIQYGSYRHALLGVSGIGVSSLGEQARQQLGIASGVYQGVLVLSVSDPAQSAGIRAGTTPVVVGRVRAAAGGDVVVAVDGRAVGTPIELSGLISNFYRPGDTATVKVNRGGTEVNVAVTLGERSPT